MRIETDKIYCGDSLQVLQTLPENAVDCCVTSPPYYALRDYGADGQIGREATPEEYVSRITAVFTCGGYTFTAKGRTTPVSYTHLIKTKFLTFTIEAKDIKAARARLARIETEDVYKRQL